MNRTLSVSAAMVGAFVLGIGCRATPYDPFVPPAFGFATGQLNAQTAPAPVANGQVGRGPALGSGGPIEAGCTFRGEAIQGEPGDTFQVACPGDCADIGYLFGTDVYTGNSAVCRAGIHAGAISSDGGVFAVRLEPGRPAYRGSKRNRITSEDTNRYERSFAVVLPAGHVSAPAAAPPPPQVIEAGCSFRSEMIQGEVGSVHTVSCPPGCKDEGYLFGTDTYTGNSSICRAAIHAGLISPNGGTVQVILDAAKPAFRGTLRNGTRSGDAGSYGVSFRMKRP